MIKRDEHRTYSVFRGRNLIMEWDNSDDRRARLEVSAANKMLPLINFSVLFRPAGRCLSKA